MPQSPTPSDTALRVQAHMSALWSHPIRNGAVLGFLGGGFVASLASLSAGVIFDSLNVPFAQPWVRDLAIAIVGAATGALGFNIAFEILRCSHNPNKKNVSEALEKKPLLESTTVNTSATESTDGLIQEARTPLHKAPFFYFLVGGFLAFTSLVFSSETLINKLGLWTYHGTILGIKAVLALTLTQGSRCAGIPGPVANTLTSVVGAGLLAEQGSDILMSTLLKNTFDNITGAFVGIGLSLAFGLVGALLGRAIVEFARATAQSESTGCGRVISGLAGAMKNAFVCCRRPAAPAIGLASTVAQVAQATV